MDDLAITTSQATSLTLRAGAIVDLPDGHLAWLRMNERAGSSLLADSSVYGNDGTFSNGRANGSYLYFPECDSSVSLPSVGTLSEGYTVGVRFKMTDNGDNDRPTIMVKDAQGSLLYVTFLDHVNNGATMIVPNQWYHAAVTVTAGETRIYLDGRLEATTSGRYLGTSQRFSFGGNQCNVSLTYRDFWLDDFELFDRVLSDAELLTAYGRESLTTSLEGTGNGVSCSSGRCPTFSDAGASFNQTQHLTVDTSSLDFGANQFSIAATVKPQSRTYPFNGTAGAHFGIDTSQDWQGVYGYEDPANSKRIFPSLFVGSNGALRVDMGDGVDTCSYQTGNGIVDFDVEQQVLVSFDGSAFTIFVDGVERATGAPAACAGVDVPEMNNIYVGRPNAAGYLYFRQVYFFEASDGNQPQDGGNDIELRINVDNNNDVFFWSADNPNTEFNTDRTDTIDAGLRFVDDSEHSFRFWEDDVCDNNTFQTNCGSYIYDDDDDNLWYQDSDKVSNIKFLNPQDPNDYRFDTDEGAATIRGGLYWSNANQFFRGTVRNLRIYDYAVSTQGAERVYNTETFALQMSFDEAPGESRFVDESGNYFEAECAATNCPDSGIPGRTNQAARFDGGVADDDGNDGVADYLSLSADEEALGLQQHDFTIMAWVKPDQVDGYRRILAAGRAASANGVGFGVRDGDLLFTTLGVKDYRSTQSDVPAGQWSHVAVSFDTNNDAHFYVNGQFIQTITGSAPANLNNDDAYRIGAGTIAGQAATSEVWDGLIDDLRILTYAADATTIQRMMSEAPLVNLHLDEDVNTTAFANDSLNGGAATCTGTTCPGAGDKGQLRESATFDGVDDALVVSGTEELELNTHTVALWVKPTQKKSLWQPLIHKAKTDSGQRTFALLINTESMTLRHSLQQSNCSTYTTRDSSATLLLNQWNHVVMTFDGAQNSLYINGALDGSVAYEGTPCQNSEPVRLAYSTASTHTAFAGNLDEITIQSGALSAAQVQDLYLYQSAWYDVKQQHTVLIDADYPTSSVVLGSDYVQPGQVLLMDVQDPVVNGVAAGIANAYYRIDGGNWVRVFPDSDGLYFVPAAATADLADGDHTIQLRATDFVAHRAEGPVQSFQIDTTAPRVGAVDFSNDLINLGFPTNITTLPDGTFTWNIEAYDDQGTVQSGIDESSIRTTVQDRFGNVVSGPVAPIWNNGWKSTFAFDSQPYGIYTVHADAQDMAGNASSGSGLLALDGLPGYGDLLIDSNIITGTDAVIKGLANDIPYPEGGRTLHFHFEEENGATLFYDGSANHFNGTCAADNCPTLARTDKLDRAARFDGGDSVLIGDQDGITAAESLGLNGDFTIMAWVKPDALSGVQQILAADQTNSPGGISFGLNGDKLELQAYGAQLHQSSVATGLSAGAWSHVAAKHSASDNTVAFYVNGKLVEAVTGATELVVNTDDAYRIGTGFSGYINELAVYATHLDDARLYNIANPVWNFAGMVRVRYRHAAGSVWPHLDPDGVALYLPLDEVVNADEFEDLSAYNRDATCNESHCPEAGAWTPALQNYAVGGFGNTPVFDGVDDYLTVPHVLDPAATDFTVSLRFKAEDFANGPKILQQTDGSGAAGRTWFGIWADGTFFTYFGGKALNHPTAVTTGGWHHAVVTYKHETQLLTLYVDGVPVTDTRDVESSDGDLVIGAHKTFSNNFKGAIDEVAVFDRALTATEVDYLMADPWYLAFWTDDLIASPNIFTTWQHAVPAGLEGPHKIDLLVGETATDYRAGVSHAVWTGEIDTTAPRVALAYTLSADKQSVTVACAAADYNLSETGWECPVDNANRSSHYKDADWFTTIFSDTEKLAGFTTAEEIFTPGPDLHVTACDLWGNCTTLAPEDTDGDGIPDHVEGEGDRDGDGILDAHDYDPDGHFYELNIGRIIAGGAISVSGPGQVNIDPDGNTGYYDWTTDGTPGLYVMTVTPPAGYIVSADCPAQPGAITPTGAEPIILGSSEVASTETLADASCAANPYYLQFNVAEGTPFVFNNNIPLTPTIEPGPGSTIFLPLVSKDAQISAAAAQPASQPITDTVSAQGAETLSHRILLPLIAKQ